ncbi:hypothetical protein GCM10010489_00510 [Microbacterium saperdae]|uniref:Luciferase-like monooxygenase n=1 Tax=Microbacterium saperdae TaxID=69368 RepID=A0A543BA73_9MICO|nr:hypothetical protein FB560_3116 [Microbacterium saperdae]GGM33629.1 hypothetical protein GCM10010489_00510 [Microbacterium saperdae]
MSENPEQRRRLAVALTGAQVLDAVQTPELWRRLHDTGVAYVVIGIDRLVDDAAWDGPGIDGSIAATYLADDTTGATLITAAAHRDHPYNLARRVASSDHLSGGRTGVLLGRRDVLAPDDRGEARAWSGARLTDGGPLAPATTRNAAEALRALWLSWPADTIVADRETGIYALSDRILQVSHTGVFASAGPLTVPTTAQGAPVLAWYAADAADLAAAEGVAELLIISDALAAAGEIADAWTLSTVDLDAGSLTELVLSETVREAAGDVVIRTTAPLARIVETLEQARRQDAFPAVTGTTLRERLGIDAPLALEISDDIVPAFAAARATR